MRRSRIFIARSAESQLKRLPEDVRLHIETHLENLVMVLEQEPPEALLTRMTREDEGFVANVGTTRILFSVDTSLRALTVQRLEQQLPPEEEKPQ
jgi:mRNA-degrading endonuclease RelE of RelBE toxin-antitoxin system